MATLSKMVIENISERMTEKSKKYWQKCEKDFRELATTFYESQLPSPVKELFKTNCEYLTTVYNLTLDGNGLNQYGVKLTKSLPAKSSYSFRFNPSAAAAEKLVKAKRKFEKAKEDYETLVGETRSALLALKTEKNVRENLPEAVPFLPPPMSNSLVVNFKSLQDRLSKQPEVKETVDN